MYPHYSILLELVLFFEHELQRFCGWIVGVIIVVLRAPTPNSLLVDMKRLGWGGKLFREFEESTTICKSGRFLFNDNNFLLKKFE